MKKIKTHFIWILLSVVIIVLDRASKALVMQYLPFEQSIPIFPYFNLLFTYNAGAAFSFLQNAGGWQEWMFGAIAVGVSVFIII